MTSVGESVTTNKCKEDGQRELQEEAGKSKKRSIASSTSKLGRKIILSYVLAIKGMNTLNIYRYSCRTDISVARGGKNDVTKQVASENHKKSIAPEKRNQRITSLM